MTTAAPEIALLNLTNAVAASRALHVVAELGVADALGPDEEVPAGIIAARSACHPDALHRVLRLLEVHGIFSSEQECWSHSEASLLLRSDHPRSLRPYARMIGQPQNWEAMGELACCVRDGGVAPTLREVGGTFGYLQRHPEQLAIFAAAMTAKSHADIGSILGLIDFGPYRTIVDVGGGRGHLLRAIVDRHPQVKGVLFDLPEVAEGVASDDRFGVVAGDFFRDDLPAADLALLMHVIHDWDDERAAEILRACARATRPGSTLLVIEWIMPDRPTDDDAANVLDVFMLAVTGGRERTAAQYTRLLNDAGYDVVVAHTTPTPLGIIEARRSAA